MSSSSRSRPDRRGPGRAAALLVAAALTQCAGPAVAAAPQLGIVAVVPSAADRQVTLVADVQPTPADPVPAGAFSVSTADATLPARSAPVVSDRLAVGLIVDASTAGAPVLNAGLSGAASFLLQLPTAARVAAIADTGQPAVLAPLRAGPKEALQALDAVQAGGTRSTSAAVTLALGELPADRDEPGVVLLLTGAPDAGGESAADLGERLRRAHALLAVVSTGTEQSYWAGVTAATGGVLVDARTAGLLAAFETAAATLRGRYLLTFPLPNRLPTWVSVRVGTAAGTLTTDVLVEGAGPANQPAGSRPALRWLLGLVVAGSVVLLAVALLLRARSAPRPQPGTGTYGPAEPAEPLPPPLAPIRARPASLPASRPASRRPPPRRDPGEPESARQQAESPTGGPATHPAAELPRRIAQRRDTDAPATLPRRADRPRTAARSTARSTARPAADKGAYARLDEQVADASAAVANGRLDRPRAVARIALAAAGRADLVDRLIDAERRMAGSRLANWPPTDMVLDLLASARRVVVGMATLAGPGGVRVEQTVLSGGDRTTHTLLRMTRHGQWVCDCRTAAELAEHLDLSTLVATRAP